MKKVFTLGRENMNEVIDIVNKFFEIPTKQDNGMKEKVNYVHNEKGKVVDIQREEYHDFSVYMGNCHLHHIQKTASEKLEKGEKLIGSELMNYEELLLAISTKYSDSCIPLYNGNKIIVEDDKLTVISEQKYMYDISKREKKPVDDIFRCSSTNIFVHMEVTEEDKKEYYDSMVKSIMLDSMFEDYWGDTYEQNHVFGLCDLRKDTLDLLEKITFIKEINEYILNIQNVSLKILVNNKKDDIELSYVFTTTKLVDNNIIKENNVFCSLIDVIEKIYFSRLSFTETFSKLSFTETTNNEEDYDFE